MDINANSRDWQRIIQKAIDSVPAAEAQVRQDLQNLMQRGIATAGLEIRCDISYLGDMLKDGLQAILAKVKKEPLPPVNAVICDASPSAIDMNLSPNGRNNIEVYGYNLDQTWLKLFHVAQNGQSDETGHFNTISPFKRVIDLGASGIALGPQSLKLRMDLGNGGYREVPVIQKWPEVCETRDFDTSSSSLQVYPTKTGSGDNEFYGHGPCVRANARVYLDRTKTQLWGHLDVDMWECPDDMTLMRSDFTEGIGYVNQVLFTADHDEEIFEIRGQTTSRLEYIDQTTTPDTKVDSGLVVRWNSVGDTDSGEDITQSYVTAVFGSVHLVLRKKDGNCVTEEELAKLMAEKRMSTTVQEHLRLKRPAVFERAKVLETLGPRRIRNF